MVEIEVPLEAITPYDPSKEELLERLNEEGRVVRFEQFIEEDSMEVRQTLDELVLEGAIARFPVGEHILIRDLRGDPEREKGWPNEEQVNDVDERGLIT